MHVNHPLLKPGTVEFRGYQANLARIASREDTLVVLPTGMGKTIVAVLVVADALAAGAQRILVLAPTRPLVDQHAKSLAALLAEPWDTRIRGVTGNDDPTRRGAAYAEPGIVVATPQVVHNDLVTGRLDAAAFDWVVFDEAHRAAGEYPYVFIGSQVRKAAARRGSPGRVLALTASPGHEARKIEEVRDALGVRHVEIRTPADPDVAPFVQEIAMEWETLPLPPALARVSSRLQEALADRVRAIKQAGFLKDKGSRPSRRDLLQLAGQLQGAIQRTPNPEPTLFSALSLQAQAMKLQHGIELAQTQGAGAFMQYLEGVRQETASGSSSKASQSVVADPRVNEAYEIARLDTAENPKMGRVGVLVQEQLEAEPDSRAIVFTHFRATCEAVVTALGKLPGVRPALFVGQAKKGDQDGLTQRQQAQAVERFKKGEFNVLVATSVAEEGLDIPETDLVVFYEPIASEIRAIQRRGRTGRKRAGRVVVLMTKGTQDEAAHWVSRRREQEMVRELHNLRGALGRSSASAPPAPQGAAVPAASPAQTTLTPGGVPLAPAPWPAAPSIPAAQPATAPVHDASFGQQPRIVCDHREQAGGVARALHELGAVLEFRQLEIGDFVLSDRVVAERKACRDFVDSLVDGRLFDQLRALQTYPRPVVLLEGESLAGHRNVSPQALMAAVASVALDYGIALLQTRDPLETARLLYAIAKREQHREQRRIAVRPAKPPMSDAERQSYLLCGLPGISDVLAARLLERFGSVAHVMRADAADLAQVDGIGPVKAREIRRILDLRAADERAAGAGLVGRDTVNAASESV